MDNREIINTITKYKLLVSKHFDVDKVVLYGSFANGTSHVGSDIDVAIIVNSVQGDFFTYAPLLWKLKRGLDDRIEPVLIENKNDESGFLNTILNSGIII
jgi:predicted nucleotidyltransferase